MGGALPASSGLMTMPNLVQIVEELMFNNLSFMDDLTLGGPSLFFSPSSLPVCLLAPSLKQASQSVSLGVDLDPLSPLSPDPASPPGCRGQPLQPQDGHRQDGGSPIRFVILPKVDPLTGLCPTRSGLDAIEQPWCSLLKHKAGLPACVANSLLFSCIGPRCPLW